jgi:rhomboid protease GluP
MDAFARLERKALAVLQPPEGGVSKAAWLHAIRDSGNYYWNKSLRVLNETNQLDVSEQLKTQRDVLIRYCNLRILSYNYIYRKMTDSASSGEDSVGYFNSQISGLLESLKKKN